MSYSLGEKSASKPAQKPYSLRAGYNADMTVEEAIDFLQEVASRYPSLGTKDGSPKAGAAWGSWVDALKYIIVKGRVPWKREQYLHMMPAQRVNDLANAMIDFLTAHEAIVLRYFTASDAKEKLSKALKES